MRASAGSISSRCFAIARGLRAGLLLGAAGFLLLRAAFPAFLAGEPFAGAGLVLAPPLLAALLAALVALRWPRVAPGVALFALALPGLLAALVLGWPLEPVPFVPLLAASVVLAALAAVSEARLARGARRTAALTWLAAPVLLLAGLALPAPSPEAPDGRDRVLILGLDAATFTILDELWERGELPHLRSFVEQGSTGVLRSQNPTFSPTVWTTIATGKDPADHGILDFFATQDEHLAAARLWEIAAAHGRSTGVFRWLVTWPPEAWGDFNVPGWMAPGPETHPPSLQFAKEIEIAFQSDAFREQPALGKLADVVRWGRGYLRHGLRAVTVQRLAVLLYDGLVRDGRWQKRQGALKTAQLLVQGDLLLHLYARERPELCAAVFYGTDTLAHTFWRYRYPETFGVPPEKAAGLGEILDDYYRAADVLLGELLALADARTTVLVVSDHGFGHYDAKKGGVLGASFELKPRMTRLCELMGLAGRASVSSVVAGYLTPHGASAQEREAVLVHAEQWLAAVTDGDGAPVFSTARTASGQLEVRPRREAFVGRSTPVTTPAGTRPYDALVEIEEQAGSHTLDGVLLARGPAVRRGHRVEGARLHDVAPTVLHLLGIPVAADMDGQVLQSMLVPGFVAARPVTTVPSYDEDILSVRRAREPGQAGDRGRVERQLEALGYLK